ncbi:hypothetical protein CesoFtcFv8_000669 [Champsocephalus esox]|uniref:Uncharacterized protein n=1 Tax=Champsocephalus esox TaxID=159716 RepID=A0AAN8D1W4_9TELE|nr:hypothetical protein CesoFtcFv8_000669 [Champsocephalus esox]
MPGGDFTHADGWVQVSVVSGVIVPAVQEGCHAHSAVAETPGTGMRTVATQQVSVTDHGLMAHSVHVANIFHRQMCVHDPGSAVDKPSIMIYLMSRSPHVQ